MGLLGDPVLDGFTVSVTDRGRLRLIVGDSSAELHPHWLRDHSVEHGEIDTTSRQRLFTPLDVPADLEVTAGEVAGDTIVVSFGDGHRATLDMPAIVRSLGWANDPEEPPEPQAWDRPIEPPPEADWRSIGSSPDHEQTDGVVGFLDAFFRYGYVVLRNTPVESDEVTRIADRLGYITGNNFGSVFDVRAEAKPTDLAYTTKGLLAHTDQPYRRPAPGIQMLHCLQNEAPGGDSTVVDGLAAAGALAAADPDAHDALVATEVVYRYDMITDTVVSRGHVLDYDLQGRFLQIRYNTKLDTPVVQPDVDLDAFYRGRRWLAEWLNDPAHQATFRLEPGDLLFVDNQRVLHGRSAFDASKGVRHLQGCYIDHDGPDTMYRLAVRRQVASPSL